MKQLELGLPSWITLIINNQSVFVKSWQICDNIVLLFVHGRCIIMYFPYFSVSASVCLCMCACFLTFYSFFISDCAVWKLQWLQVCCILVTILAVCSSITVKEFYIIAVAAKVWKIMTFLTQYYRVVLKNTQFKWSVL